MTSSCPTCAEFLGDDAPPRCPWCGERLEDGVEVPSLGYGADSLAVAVVCVLGTALVMTWALLI